MELHQDSRRHYVKYGKTLRGLISDISFDDLVPLIKAESRSSCSVAQYKQAFDILLRTDSSQDRCRDIEINRMEAEGHNGLSAHSLEGTPWEEVIEGDIYIEDGAAVSDVRIAFTILWHLTFYGYDEQSKKEVWRQITSGSRYDNKYGRMAFETEIRRDFLLADRKTREDIIASVKENGEQGIMSYSLTEEQWNAIEHRRAHSNGPKRKRYARLKKRIIRLERMARCENTISRLLEGQKGSVLSRGDLSFLRDADRRCGCEFQSHACDASSRLDYITELIARYGAADLGEQAYRIVIRIAASGDCPLDGREVLLVSESVSQAAGQKDFLLSLAEDNSLGQEISVLVVGAVCGKAGNKEMEI